MARALMIQGTMSNVGKSLITAGLCRIFTQDGYKTAPFKSQNMALNSYITASGGEIGRAQAVQAEASGKKPDVRMNPILLKPTTDTGSQVIVMGSAAGNMSASEYYRKKTEYIPVIRSAYEGLAAENDIIVIEGAGSPVEINLSKNDIVNMGMADIANAAVLLVGDIDRGGVFAQLVGTMELLDEAHRNRVLGFIINKFRGDVSLLDPGLTMLSEKTGKPVLGVVPWSDLHIEDEDSLSGESLFKPRISAGRYKADIAVIRLKRISNFTDTASFETDEDVCIRYVKEPEELGDPDMIIIPGSKNTIDDMRFLRESGLEAAILKANSHGVIVFGICGGYQLMGRKITDGSGTEGGGSIRGMGLLPVETVFETSKVTRQTKGRTLDFNGTFERLSHLPVNGYEIHMGRSCRLNGDGSDFARTDGPEGCVKGRCIGTYLHGIFDDTPFKEAVIDMLFDIKGISRRDKRTLSYGEYREEQYDKLANVLRQSLDIDKIYRLIEGTGI
ncbi:MAG: cobyric acid synthase [Lachnospiraceae bacterium]|nr:cobyric acid synthase [Lachnospiraceae bacterium]